MIRNSLVMMIVVLIAACAEVQDESLITVEVTQRNFALDVPAFGELEPVVSHKISAPGGRQPKAIEWLIDENQHVSKGQVVVRFDSEQLTLDQRKEQLAMMVIDRDIQQKFAEQTKQKNELSSEDDLIEKEFAFADAYAIDDLMLYSKLEIIDTLSNKEFLSAKEEFIDWKSDSLDQRTESAMDVLDVRKQGHQRKFEQHASALAELEIYAPIDGQLIYEKNHRGEKPSIGQTVFPGAVIANIPDLSSMQAKLQVIDKYAIGLKEDVPVTMTLDANPGITISGTVTSVSGFPRSIKRGDPVKYFEVIVALQAPEDTLLLPGQKVAATIHVASFENRLSVPLQAIYNDQGDVFVYITNGTSLEKRTVTLGVKSLYEAEVTSGVSSGDQVVLNVPEGDHG